MMENKGKPILWIVIPCYNEEEVLPVTAPLFEKELLVLRDEGKISDKSRILFVNDGSKDRTWEIITELSRTNEHFIGISQSRNRGHQNAVLAGLMEARDVCDVTISIDCDGQDDISAMGRMMDEYLKGAEVVYGVRSKRDTDTFFKRFTAQTFYKLLNMMGAEVVYDHADYRLISSRVLAELQGYEEVNVFLRGLIPLVGFKSATVDYERKERMAGKSHYPLKNMINLAVNGITSMSIKPISIITSLGFITSFLGFLGIIWAIIGFILGHTIAGWASTVVIFLFIGGVQLVSLGVIGEYVGKTYLESKHRPRYIISDKTWEPYERKYRG